MGYKINEEVHRIIVKHLKNIEVLVNRVRLLKAYTKSTNLPIYLERNVNKIGNAGGDASRIKVSLRQSRQQAADYYLLDHLTMSKIIGVSVEACNVAKAVSGDLNAVRKTVKNVLEVIHHEINSHLLDDIIKVNVQDLDKLSNDINLVIDGHKSIIDLFNTLEEV